MPSHDGRTSVETIEAETSSVHSPVNRYPRCSPMPTPSSRWSVANTTSTVWRVASPSGPSGAAT